MEILGIIIGVLGVIGTVYYGRRSREVENAFAKYIDIEKDIKRLELSDLDNKRERLIELEKMKEGIYRNAYKRKSNTFSPGDRVKLVKIPEGRSWISSHSRIGMTGIVVDYGPGTYEFTVYWSEVDYAGEPLDEHNNRWQVFHVNENHIERIA